MPLMMIQVVVSGGASRRVSLDKAEVLVGRSADSDVVLPGDKVSRHHCLLTHRDGRWRLRDCDSQNGVYLDRGSRGVPFLARHDVLMSGDSLYIGHCRLSLLMEDEDGVLSLEDAGAATPFECHDPHANTVPMTPMGMRLQVEEWLAERTERPPHVKDP